MNSTVFVKFSNDQKRRAVNKKKTEWTGGTDGTNLGKPREGCRWRGRRWWTGETDCPGRWPWFWCDKNAASRSPATLVSMAKMRAAFVHLFGHVGDGLVDYYLYSGPDCDVCSPLAFSSAASFSAPVIWACVSNKYAPPPRYASLLLHLVLASKQNTFI